MLSLTKRDGKFRKIYHLRKQLLSFFKKIIRNARDLINISISETYKMAQSFLFIIKQLRHIYAQFELNSP